jgi:type VII secretion-associated serine protease mycosin
MRIRRAVAAALLAGAIPLVVPAAPAHADAARANQWHLKALNVAAAHRVSQGEGVTVAVIDSGVARHPDLRNNLLPGTDIVPGGAGNGLGDADGHGTAMAGLIAAHGRSGGNGALGIAPKAKILPIRNATPKRAGNNEDLANGISYAIAQGVDVISISTGNSPDTSLTRAVEAAVAADIVVVAAAGNRPKAVVVSFPAFLDGVVAVGASGRDGQRAAISVTGDKLALLAPGTDISSTNQRGGYTRSNGTSNSTAIVAGAAALIRSRYPDLSAEDVVHRLTATATDKGATGRDPEYGYGVLNLVAALTADVPRVQPSGAPSAGTPSAPTPTAVGATTLPKKGEAGSAGVISLICLGLFVAAAIAVAAFVVVRRRQQTAGPAETAGAGAPPDGPGAGAPPAGPATPTR